MVKNGAFNRIIAALLLLALLLPLLLSCGREPMVEPFTRPPDSAFPQDTSAVQSAGPKSTVGPAASLTVKNELQALIAQLYISPAEASNWGNAAVTELGAGEERRIDFAAFSAVPGEKYDIGTIDENGVNYDCFDVVLLDGDTISLSGNAEKAEFRLERAGGAVETLDAKVYNDEPSEVKRVSFITPYVSRSSDYSVDGETGEVYADYSFTELKLNSKDAGRFPLLEKTLEAENKRRSETSREAYAEFAENALKLRRDEPSQPLRTAAFSDEVFIKRTDEKLLSILLVQSKSVNGVEELTYSSANFDPETGALLMLSDALKETQNLQAIIYDELVKAYGGFPFDDELELAGEFSRPSEKLIWSVEPKGLGIMLNGAAFEAENKYYEIFIPFEDHPELLAEKYRPANENYALTIPCGRAVHTMAEGKRASVEVDFAEGEADEPAVLRIVYGGAEYSEELSGVYDAEASLAHIGGRELLYLDMLSDNDNRFLLVFSLEDGGIIPLGTFPGSWSYAYSANAAGSFSKLIMPMADPASFSLYTTTELLGTVDASKTYSIGENGMPETEDTYFNVIRPDVEFTLKTPLELPLVSETGEAEEGTAMLEAGSTLVYFRTDGEKTADLALEDGRFVRITVENHLINGASVDEVLDGVVYSG